MYLVVCMHVCMYVCLYNFLRRSFRALVWGGDMKDPRRGDSPSGSLVGKVRLLSLFCFQASYSGGPGSGKATMVPGQRPPVEAMLVIVSKTVMIVFLD